MCGICGFYQLANPAEGRSLLTGMTSAIRHRGPDGAGVYLDPSGSIGLGNTRLAVIDVAGGRQPIISDDGRYVLVLNGEIYNYQPLRKELIELGYKFHTTCDSEVLLHCYRQWGRQCLSRLRGMFAFAVLDTTTRELFLARDRVGIKPVYYYRGPEGFFFASELKAILTSSAVPRRLDSRAIADYFVLGYPNAGRTFFSGIHELPAGHWLTVTPDGMETAQYWSWAPATNGHRRRDTLEEVEDALTETLRDHLISDVPLAAFLSGGIDSSLLVALIARRLNRSIETFSVKFDEAAYDESGFAASVARSLGTNHHCLEIPRESCNFEVVEKIIDHFDQPFADSSALPTYLLCEQIRKHVKVAIGGDGGDEMFGGYTRFKYADAAQSLGAMPGGALAFAGKLARVTEPIAPSSSRRVQRLLRAARVHGSDRLLEIFSWHAPAELPAVLQPELRELLGTYSPRFAGISENGCGGNDYMQATVSAALPGDYLRKVDMMSSAHGLEVRVPFLGERILDMSATLPREQKYSWSENKIVLRRLAARHLPAEVVQKRKQGFSIPLDRFLGRPGRERIRQTLGASSARIRDFVQPSYYEPLLNDFVSGAWDRSRMSRENLCQRVYLLWAFERWLNKWNPAIS